MLCCAEQREGVLDSPSRTSSASCRSASARESSDRAGHHREGGEHPRARGLGIFRHEACRELVSGTEEAVSKRLLDRGLSPPDLVEQGSRWATVLGSVTVLGGKVPTHELLDAGITRRQCAEMLCLRAQLIGDRGGDEVVFGGEMRVEIPVGQPRVGHERRDSRAVDAVVLEPAAGRLDNPTARGFLVFFAVPRHSFLRLLSVGPPYSITIVIVYYDHTSMDSGAQHDDTSASRTRHGRQLRPRQIRRQGLVKAGFDVVGTSRNTGGLDPREGVTFRDLDVTSDDSVALLIKRVLAQFGRIDVLVNNAGMGISGATEENSIGQAQRLFDINVFGVIRMTNAVLPHMRAQKSGRIINISSVFGFMPAPYMAAYSATKYAVEGYSESVDHEVRGHGIRVVLVEPAGTRTGFDDNTTAPDNPSDVYARQRRPPTWYWLTRSTMATTPPSSPRRSSLQPPIETRSCVIPPASERVNSVPCAASSPPASSTSSCANTSSSHLTFTPPQLRQRHPPERASRGHRRTPHLGEKVSRV